jgi:hypothetical protein
MLYTLVAFAVALRKLGDVGATRGSPNGGTATVTPADGGDTAADTAAVAAGSSLERK